MATNVYEGMYILDSNRYGRQSDAVSDTIREMIENAGGEILVSRLWEERRLAYPIKGQRKGTYWLTYFRLEGSRLGEIRRACQLSENVLRVLFLKVEPRIVDALVEHAMVGSATPKTAEAATEEPVAAAVESGDAEPAAEPATEEKSE